MGKTVTPKYFARVSDVRFMNGKPITTSFDLGYDGKRMGKPTDAKVEKLAIAYGKSLEAGECNGHISEALGFIPYPNKYKIIRNDGSGRVVAEWKAPAFMVW